MSRSRRGHTLDQDLGWRLRKLDGPSRCRIRTTIELLATSSHRAVARMLVKGQNEWCVRTGDRRIIYEINDGMLTVLVLALGHRREIHQRR